MNKATETRMQYTKSLLRHAIGQKHSKIIYTSRNVKYPRLISQYLGTVTHHGQTSSHTPSQPIVIL